MAISPKKLGAFVKKDSFSPFREKPKDSTADEELPSDEEGDAEEAPADEPKIDVGEIARQIKAGNGSPKLMKLSKGITPETNPPKWVAHKAIWQKAKKAVTGEEEPSEEELEETGYDEPYGVISHVYRRMGGGIKGE